MATLWEPVGPEGRGVYWRRRLVLIGIVLLLLVVVLKACSGGGSDGADKTASTSSPSASAKATTTKKATPSASTTAKASPSASKSAAAITTCKDSQVQVTARPITPNYAVGDTVTITYVVSTKGGVTCKRDVGGAADEVRVLSGGRIIWSSDYCSPGGKPDIRTIGPDAAFSVQVAWDGKVTASSCPADRLPAPAGVYQVVGRNGAVLGPAAKLTLG